MRLRTIKPGFFKNEDLADIEPLGRILFAGLWCMADRAGRLEDRPKRIKAEVLPYDACDVDALLDALARHGFIVRYTSKQDAFIQVVNFKKHQTPHMREPASSLPAPDEHSAGTVQAPDEHRAKHPPSPADIGINLGIGINRELEPPVVPHGGTHPAWFVTLQELPRFDQDLEHCRSWLNEKSIDEARAEQTALELKAKWGGKGWRYSDPWATFQAWVKRSAGNHEITKNGHRPAVEITAEPGTAEWFEQQDRSVR